MSKPCYSIAGTLHRTRACSFGTLRMMLHRRKGTELFASAERLICVDGDGRHPVVEERRLPLVTLGHGRFSLPDKLQALVHQTWLEYGPCVETRTRVNVAVRQCLSDQGTEFGLSEASDVSSACAHSVDADTRGECMFPYAIQVPGPQHILDTILQDAVDRLSWWHAWESDAKCIAQWLHSESQ